MGTFIDILQKLFSVFDMLFSTGTIAVAMCFFVYFITIRKNEPIDKVFNSLMLAVLHVLSLACFSGVIYFWFQLVEAYGFVDGFTALWFEGLEYFLPTVQTVLWFGVMFAGDFVILYLLKTKKVLVKK